MLVCQCNGWCRLKVLTDTDSIPDGGCMHSHQATPCHQLPGSTGLGKDSVQL